MTWLVMGLQITNAKGPLFVPLNQRILVLKASLLEVISKVLPKLFQHLDRPRNNALAANMSAIRDHMTTGTPYIGDTVAAMPSKDEAVQNRIARPVA